MTLFIAAEFMVIFTVPWQPAREAPIGAFDFSWMLLLHDALATGRQFGTQIILPQGPLGFVGTSVYDPRTYWILIAARIAVAGIAFWAMWRAAGKFMLHPLLALPWLLAITALMGRSPDHFFPTCGVLLLLTYFVVDDRRLRAPAFALVIVMAVASLIKVNQPFYALVVVGVIAIDRLRQRNRWFLGLPAAYAGAVLLLYFAARQKPSSIGPFLWGWFQVTAGHTEAVGLPGPSVDAVAYLVVVALVCGIVALYAWRTPPPGVWVGKLLLPVGIAGVLLLLYKHSFMRQDLMHVHMGPMVALATAILFTPALWPLGGRPLRGYALAVISVGGVLVSSILSSYDGEGLLGYGAVVGERCAANVSAALSPITDHGRLHREWADARQRLRDDNPLPVKLIEGPVDVYPHRQDVVLAYGFDYQPRPVVSSLVATSPVLAALNARHLQTAAAPRTVLFDVELVDHNFPTMLDGESLPGLLTLYDVIDASGAMLVLHRAPSPRAYRFTRLLSCSARFDEAIEVPAATDAPLWARIHFKRRAAGRVLSMLYKPPTLGIAVHTRDGADNFYRLLPEMAGTQGFLLSPLIKDRGSFARLASPTWARDLAATNVTTMTISVDDGSQSASFDPEFTVELQRLEIMPGK